MLWLSQLDECGRRVDQRRRLKIVHVETFHCRYHRAKKGRAMLEQCSIGIQIVIVVVGYNGEEGFGDGGER
jgi:hypothetical protein